jgi:hypothetical protein
MMAVVMGNSRTHVTFTVTVIDETVLVMLRLLEVLLPWKSVSLPPRQCKIRLFKREESLM